MRFFLPGCPARGCGSSPGARSASANVVSGIALIVVLLLAFPPTRRPWSPRARAPDRAARLVGYVLAQLVVSNVLVAREIVSRRSRVRTGVVGYRVQQPSDLTLTLMSNILALAPGTMPVDVTLDPPMLYVHFLLLSDVEDARRTIGRLERSSSRPSWRSTSANGRPRTNHDRVTFVVLIAAAVLFMVRLCIGPTLADRVIALNGLVLAGMGAIATQAVATGNGDFLPALVAIALVGPISTGMIARYMERNRE